MSGGVFGGVVAFILLAFVFPKVFKLPEGYAEAGPSKEDLEFELGSTLKAAEVKGYCVSGLLAALWCAGIWFWMKQTLAASAPEGSVFFSQSSDTIWYIAMLFGGIGIMALGDTLALFFAGQERENYIRLQNLKNNFRMGGVARTMGLFCTIGAVLMAVLSADCRTVADSKGMLLNPLMSFGSSENPWGSVSRLIYAKAMRAPNGKVVEKKVWQIHFKGGDVWSSDHAPGKHPDTEYSQLMAYASKMSKVKPETFPLLQDADK